MLSLVTYLAMKQQEQALKNRLQKLETDPDIRRMLGFRKKLKALLVEFGKIPNDVIAHIDPRNHHDPSQQSLLKYINPYTEEEVRTRDPEHKVLVLWREQYGSQLVDTWTVSA